jgi:hypothetical protein
MRRFTLKPILGFHKHPKNPLDWFKGKSTGDHAFYHEVWRFPGNFVENNPMKNPYVFLIFPPCFSSQDQLQPELDPERKNMEER